MCFLSVIFASPLVYIFLDSFQVGGKWSISNYIQTFFQPAFITALTRTLKLSTIVTLVAALLSYPAALAVFASKKRALLMSLLILPLMTNPVARTYCWLVILGRYGLVNTALLSLGIIKSPVQILYTESAVAVGLLQLFLPFMVLSIVSALENMPPDVREAAYSLGATGWRTFWKVIFPLSREGLVFGGTLVFTGCSTAYVTPAMLGGTRLLTLSTLLQQRALVLLRWSEAAVIAIVMVGIVVLVNRMLKGKKSGNRT